MRVVSVMRGPHAVAGASAADTICVISLLCRANAQQPKLFVGMILILIFAEALALYGLIGECLADAC